MRKNSFSVAKISQTQKHMENQLGFSYRIEPQFY